MAISSFGKSKGGTHEPVAAPTPVSTAGNLSAFIDQGSEFEGKLNFKDTVRIDGVFRGEITSENTLLIGETGEIEAKIQSQNVVVCGVVNGDIIAGRQVVLHKGARMDGDISTPSIVIEEGAVFNGQVSMQAAGASGGLAPVKDKDMRASGKTPETRGSSSSSARTTETPNPSNR